MAVRCSPPFLLASALLSFSAAPALAGVPAVHVVDAWQAAVESAAKPAPEPGDLASAWATWDTSPAPLPQVPAISAGDLRRTLHTLAQRLAALSPTGTVDASGGRLRLSGSTARQGVHVFDVAPGLLDPFVLDSYVAPDEWLVVNLTAPMQVEFQDDLAGSGLSAVADRLIFNVVNAPDVLARRGQGLLLAPHSDVVAASSGAWAGMVVADDLRHRQEVGRESLRERRQRPREAPVPFTAAGTLLMSRRG
jgi:choice-of-anchor A domain-containing protein